MMQINIEAEKVLVANKAVDFRQGLNGLCALVVSELQENPVEGIYVFYNRRKNRIKVIGWHNNGFILLYKRLEAGKFWIKEEADKIKLDSKQLNWLIMGADWKLLSGGEKPEFTDFA